MTCLQNSADAVVMWQNQDVMQSLLERRQRKDGVVRCHGLSSKKMAPIISDCGEMRSPSTK